MVPKLSVHGWLAPWLEAWGEAAHYDGWYGEVKLLTSWYQETER